MDFFQNKRILVTGGLGFIGSNLAIAFMKSGATVTIIDTLHPHGGGNSFNIHGYEDQIAVYFYDISDIEKIRPIIADVDIIINCAALTWHSLSMKDPGPTMQTNCTGVICLLEVVKTVNPKVIFVQIGTTTQFGKNIYNPADENHPEFPLDFYSASKTFAEKTTLIYFHSYGLKTIAIRLPNTYGPRAAIHSNDLTSNNYFIGLALQNRSVTIYGDGYQKRNILYIDDAVDAIMKVIETPSCIGEVLLAVHDEHHSVREFAENMVQEIGRGKVDYIPWPETSKRIEIGDATYTNEKIKQMCGWYPKISLQEGLRKTKDYYSPCLEKYLKT